MDGLSIVSNITTGPRGLQPVRARAEATEPRPGARVGDAAQAAVAPIRDLGPGARAALVRSNATGPSAPQGQAEPSVNPDGLTDEERSVVKDLQARDAEVRRHEEAHARVGAQYAGQPSYTYQTGPDGKRYAIGGKVSIDIAPVPENPEATIEKMRVVKAAALAPVEPSAADRRVAAIADAQRLQAVAALAAERAEPQSDADISASARILARGVEDLPGQQLDQAA